MAEAPKVTSDRKARMNSILERISGMRNPRMAEIGVFVGGLSEMLLRHHTGMHLVMVDSWAPAKDLPDAYRATGDVHANQTWAEANANQKEARNRVRRYSDRTTILHMPSIVAATFCKGPLDLVFLDADHSYDAVKADLVAWAPKVKSGGWIGGHDYGHTDPAFDFSGVKRAVDEWAITRGPAIELGGDFTWFCRLP